MRSILATFVVLTTVSEALSAIQCYICDGEREPACKANPFDPFHPVMIPTCTGRTCVKIKYDDNYIFTAWFSNIERTCSDTKIKDGCSYGRLPDNTTVKTCHCSTNNCNHGRDPSANMAGPRLLTALALLSLTISDFTNF